MAMIHMMRQHKKTVIVLLAILNTLMEIPTAFSLSFTIHSPIGLNAMSAIHHSNHNNRSMSRFAQNSCARSGTGRATQFSHVTSIGSRSNIGIGFGFGRKHTTLSASSADHDQDMEMDDTDSDSGSGTTIEDEMNLSNKDADVDANPNATADADADASTDVDPLVAFGNGDVGGFDPSEKIPIKRPEKVIVGNPQLKVKKKEKSVTAILQELAEIQKAGPRKYCIVGTRHCSYLHQQIIELLSYALVLSENHVYTSGAGGTNAAAIRGALRAERPDLLTVILPQSLNKQPDESQELLRDVEDLITMPQNDAMSLDVASRVCNSKLLSETDQLIAFAFHESKTVIEATKEAKKLEMLVTMLFLD